jgi:hypothetical protein
LSSPLRNYLGALLVLFGALLLVFAIEDVFAAWWEIDEDESLLPLMSASLPFLVAFEVLGRGDRDPVARFRPGLAWASERFVAASLLFGGAGFVWGLIGGVLLASESWIENVAASIAIGAAFFGIALVSGYLGRADRRRWARKHGRPSEEFLRRKPPRVVRVLLWAFLALILLLELNYELNPPA